ncbi:YARHG domain-containing protein [Dysgonomonas alginatilytica]|uniref:YARHG domain-containing protein n=1 Tax=Dysgonomonas alginatilytica TaxID=1605892 RepID=A0A2V3PU73_9BACT|nr:YARHG domain-containing protein [Dysgonomonas alginatilytica]PXV69260.1 YARHG domain-containing protein [Dysgonomonas alginatilytica]
MFIRLFVLFFILLSGSLSLTAQGITDCTTCSTTLLKPQDIDTLSVDELRLLTNEIYARKGYKFSNERYQDYFQGFEWYKPLADNSQVKLSTAEEKNVKLLQDRRKAREEERQVILSYFKGLKLLAVNGNNAELKIIFASSPYAEEASIDYLKAVLVRMDFDDVNWYKNNALHRVEVDNGYVKMRYSFSISSGGIALEYNYMAHSDLMEDFGTMFSGYMSEEEYAVWWVFSYENGKVVFKEIGMAG